MKLTKIIKKPRVWIFIFFLLISILAIGPHLPESGVMIKNVEVNSSADLAGIKNPSDKASPTSLEIIKTIGDQPINSLEEYSIIINNISLNETVQIETNKNAYLLKKDSLDLGITVIPVQSSNLRKGLDLAGGTRVLLKPEQDITDVERDELIQVMNNRLNTYGLSDIQIKKADDILGNKYILIEIAGASVQDVKELVASQGIFEAKIGNVTIFIGGKEDIPFVCRNDGTCTGIRQCSAITEGYFCSFEFQITLSQEAAKRHAEATKDLAVVPQDKESYLEKPLDLYLDGELVDSLNIGESLKGTPATSIVISGPGIGADQELATEDALGQMNKLQTILITGSLPTSLEIVKIDTISPLLGEEFLKNIILTGVLALVAVSLVIVIRYRKPKIVAPMLIIVVSEIIITLGFAALFRYNLDLAAIAGVIAAVGTGVDDQIVIFDEINEKETEDESWKKRIKKAFFIVFAAYAATAAAMLPLLKAGAGLLTGFALTTLIGISVGVFITRPAFAVIVQSLFEEKE